MLLPFRNRTTIRTRIRFAGHGIVPGKMKGSGATSGSDGPFYGQPAIKAGDKNGRATPATRDNPKRT